MDGSLAPLSKVDVVDTAAPNGGMASDLTIEFVPVAGGALLPWAASTLANRSTTKKLEVLSLDYAYKLVGNDPFQDATLREIDFPALDAASKEVAKWTLKVKATGLPHVAGDQTVTPVALARPRLLASNFRLAIDGLDCSHTKKVGAMVVTSSMIAGAAPAAAPTGYKLPTMAPRDQPLAPSTAPFVAKASGATSSATISNFAVTVSLSHGGVGFQQWLSSGRAPKNGTLTFLATDLVTVLCTFTLNQLSVVQVATTSATDDARAELSIANMQLACPGL